MKEGTKGPIKVRVAIDETAAESETSGRRFHVSLSEPREFPDDLISHIGNRLYVAKVVRLSRQRVVVTIGPSIGLSSRAIQCMLWHATENWNTLRGHKDQLQLVP